MERHTRTTNPAKKAAPQTQDTPALRPEPAPAKAVESALFVEDPTALNGYPPRTHELLIDGRVKSYVFAPGQKLSMPYSHAVKFLAAGFIVTDAEDRIMVSAPRGPDPHATERFQFGPEEIVARYDELTRPALLLRVNQTTGGEAYTSDHAREDLIAFLKVDRDKREAVLKTRRRNDGTASDGDSVGDMSPAELDKMFGEEAA